MKKKIYIYLALGLNLVLGLNIANAVTLTGYSGSLTNGNSVVLTGSGLGSKASYQPLMNETMESGFFSSKWTDTHNLGLDKNSTNQRWSGSFVNAYCNMNSSQRKAYFTHDNTVYPVWYIRFWMKPGANFDYGAGDYTSLDRWFSNVKIIRLWNPGSTIENFYVSYNGLTDELYITAENITGEKTNYAYQGFRSRLAKDQWHLWQFEWKENSAPAKADGIYRLWIDGALIASRTNVITRGTFAGFKRPFIIGFEDEWNMGSAGDHAPNDFWMDDIVTDNTWTRFELSTCQNYSGLGCKSEYQPLTQVSDIQATFTFYQGQLPQGPVYGFWTDAQGNRNATGLSMQIGNVIAPPPPPLPIPPPPSSDPCASQTGNFDLSGSIFLPGGNFTGTVIKR